MPKWELALYSQRIFWSDFLDTIKKSGVVISANGCIGERKRSVSDNR